jgi:hypothetical protein
MVPFKASAAAVNIIKETKSAFSVPCEVWAEDEERIDHRMVSFVLALKTSVFFPTISDLSLHNIK